MKKVDVRSLDIDWGNDGFNGEVIGEGWVLPFTVKPVGVFRLKLHVNYQWMKDRGINPINIGEYILARYESREGEKTTDEG